MIIKVIKKIIFSILIIYGLDVILSGFNIIVPLNIYTIGIVSLLGFPGLIMLALSFFFLLWKEINEKWIIWVFRKRNQWE